ncbi:arginine--tRNA ligase [Domibacillus sp. DTU_2020_1001157_1_SI_ALB_TIR_016]|uniref:arginine--tRNA ligase n=1 Tax=Domibacillus sp. DTU_2020_1001157_1_SI_ALB_TIR_016 TaxID=3077789 RepID=UPI0028EB3A0A|nr:arginine--tRNA ligase [Domibacillus sp. DTU_2020_1001157_1_SI_ALB_TIR_016]WNS78513.1 arginine--tRNA ligase [Domibacillus sp. DTU_2020_1001157_1_SI_ALB_TIR_016]
MNFKSEFAEVLFSSLNGELEKSKLEGMIEKPRFEHMGDMAFPCFELSKIFRKAPHSIALELSEKIQTSIFEKVEAVNGYVNVFLNKKMVSSEVIKDVLSKKDQYGNVNNGNGETITIDFSSPNIAKPFSMGHLRSTVIGNAITLIAEKNGFSTVRINHLGDWGTQFGKLIVAYKMWGNEEEIKKDPIKELLKLYIKFHDEAERHPELNDRGREWFKMLEDSNEEALALWKWFREESLKEFSKIYDLLGITFDSYRGEAFYNDKMESIVQLLNDNNLLMESEGAQVVSLNDESLPPCLIKKKDGTTLYATRDLAAAVYRKTTYQFAKSIYVVGNEQALHFKQLFMVLKKMEYEWHEDLVHVPFGMILKEGKKMSTRKGKVVLLEDVLSEAIDLALDEIMKKNPGLSSKEEVARQVGTGAVIFHDLKHYRQNDIEFSLKDMLKFEGETGPYVQYTHARAASLLRKGAFEETNDALFVDDKEAWPVITALMSFPDVVNRAFTEYDPSQVAKYVIDLSQVFNKFYSHVRILDNNGLKQARLSLVFAVKIVLKEGLRLLGVKAPKEM